ncbi:MAG: hypothetical protein N2517_09325 [Ignavibacteria bacterium]|nr:hypothetical protein [Ignavibacteria bacterium]
MKQVNFRIPNKWYEELQQISQKQNEPLSNIFRECIEKYLKSIPRKWELIARPYYLEDGRASLNAEEIWLVSTDQLFEIFIKVSPNWPSDQTLFEFGFDENQYWEGNYWQAERLVRNLSNYY